MGTRRGRSSASTPSTAADAASKDLGASWIVPIALVVFAAIAYGHAVSVPFLGDDSQRAAAEYAVVERRMHGSRREVIEWAARLRATMPRRSAEAH